MHSNNQSEHKKIHCNKCVSGTKHKCLYCDQRTFNVANTEIYAVIRHAVFECLGCKTITFEQLYWFSDWDSESIKNATPIYYPPRVSRRTPDWIESVPRNIRAVLDEVYLALQTDSRYLATVGARTAIDLLMNDKIGEDLDSFAKKIKKLKDQNFIESPEADLITAVVEAGNASAHRGYAPEARDIELLMDILESILEKTYVTEAKRRTLVSRAAALKKKIPPRKLSN